MHQMKKRIDDLKQLCIHDKIPIITDEALSFIKNYIEVHQVKKILEIGSAYGYSSISFSLTGAFVTTIERDLNRYSIAKTWIHELDNNIKIIHADALTYDLSNEKFDMVFIDGAKSQYTKFFEKYMNNLNDDGVIICDNIDFHGMKVTDTKNRNTKALIRKLELFRSFLFNHDAYETTYYPIGDGLTVTRKIKI